MNLNSQIKEKGYIIQEKIGQGNYVEIFRALQIDKNQTVAIKRLINNNNKLHLEVFKKQKDILNKIKNEKYSVKIIEDFQFYDQQFTAIVLEYYECNFNQIFEVNKFNFEQIVAFSYQILQGLFVLQQNAVIIKNLKSDIILFSKDKGQFVIADFGNSYLLSDDQYKINQITDTNISYNQEVDVYAIGQLILELFLSRHLTLDEKQKIKSQSLFEILQNLITAENKSFVNEILINMLNPDEKQRLQPFALIGKIKQFQVNENCLKELKQTLIEQEKQLKKISFSRDNNIKENTYLKDYQEIQLNYRNLVLNVGTQAVANSIEQLKNLISLNLNFGHNYCGEGPQIIGKAIENLKQITYLNIKFDNCDSTYIVFLGQSLQKLQSLTFLTLNFNDHSITKQILESFGLSLQKLKNLVNLNLDINGVDPYDLNGAVSLAKSLTALQNIVTLNLSFGNNFIRNSSWWRKTFLKKKKLVILQL
ncbi:hypothetical protein ABPG74_022765 [Tetrahymena malaccensis]